MEDIIKDLNKSSSLDDLWYIQCKVSLFFEEENNQTSEYFKDHRHLFLEILSTIFSCRYFNQSLDLLLNRINHEIEGTEKSFRSLIHERYNNENIKGLDEEFAMKMFLQIGFLCITVFLGDITHHYVKSIRNILTEQIQNLDKENSHLLYFDLFCEIISNYKIKYNNTFPRERLGGRVDDKLLFRRINISCMLAEISFVCIPQLEIISKALTGMTKSRTFISNKLCRLYGYSAISEKTIERRKKGYEDMTDSSDLSRYLKYFRTNNERIVGYIINKVSEGFKYDDYDVFDDKITEKIESSIKLTEKIEKYVEERLSAFCKEGNENTRERANKVYLETIKLMSILKVLARSANKEWRKGVAIRAFEIWIDDIHQIINKYEIIDDRDEIKDLLLEESQVIERKTSLFISTEEQIGDKESERKKGKAIFYGIIKTILGMMNSQGGDIIVGFSEHPNKIKNENVKKNLIVKGTCNFFDVGYELKKKGWDVDSLKRHIQDLLKKETGLEIPRMDNYRSLCSILLRDEVDVDKSISVIKISVKKSDNPIFSVISDKGGIAVKLLKRVSGRTIYVDPRGDL